jgi:hypothetical protein
VNYEDGKMQNALDFIHAGLEMRTPRYLEVPFNVLKRRQLRLPDFDETRAGRPRLMVGFVQRQFNPAVRYEPWQGHGHVEDVGDPGRNKCRGNRDCVQDG